MLLIFMGFRMEVIQLNDGWARWVIESGAPEEKDPPDGDQISGINLDPRYCRNYKISQFTGLPLPDGCEPPHQTRHPRNY
jgi:hypothetical protein